MATFDPTNIITEAQGTAQIEAMLTSTVARHATFLASQGSATQPAKAVVVRSSVQGESLELPTESEAYTLSLKEEDGHLVVNIVADTYFGARHGVETLFQLAIWDPASSSFLLPTGVQIEDSPHFPHRGVMLDTARNFIPIPDILKLIDSMSYSKQNVFHWHITDSQSFPLLMPSLPDFVRFGAYRQDQVYMPDQVKELVEYAILELQNVSNLSIAKANVLGGEVALWTEQADAATMMSRIEPRASAYAERLWRGPLTGNWVEAERRLVLHRERIASRGIMADTLTHGWCRQNEGKCILEDGMGETAPIF